MKLSDIHIRDPFVLPLFAENCYFLYGTMGEFTWKDTALGFDYYVSADLENWTGPFPAFRPPEDFWSDRNFWAPEVHRYQSRYYLFASFKAEGTCRGTQILEADTPKGPFSPVSEKPTTPSDWECLDGTLFMDNDGQPWMVFCHEWVQVKDGEICAFRLTEDLKSAVGQPQKLFCASEAPWADEIMNKGRRGYVTDGPWLHRLSNGELVMLWSSFRGGQYAIGMAHSESGGILGPWKQEGTPLYAGDGGHCMVFRDFGGQLKLAFHRPNQYPNERPMFMPLVENVSRLSLG